MLPPDTTVAHIGVAVPNATAAADFYHQVLGVTPGPTEHADGAKIVPLVFGDVEVELLEPERADGPIAKFLAKRGAGIHHVCFRVPDIEAALERCRQHGYQLIDEVPRLGAHNKRIAFVHPKTTSGILIELTE